MLRQKNTTIHFLTTPPHGPYPPTIAAVEEFDESDVIWNDNDDENNTIDDNLYHTSGGECRLTTNRPSSLGATVPVSSLSSPRGFTAGISVALLSEELPQSPTSIQRKTTSSPVAMISSSFTKSNVGGGGPMVGSYSCGSKRFHMSAPVNVPVWPNRLKYSGPKFGLSLDEDEGEDKGVQDKGEMVPPHEIVARSHNTTTFSVIEGAGRTLKGRDLTAVRNAVFQKTGFLD